jgi:hypothetical protein
MESLLTLSIGNYHAVELALRLTVALSGMTALMLLLCTTCTASRFRLPLILSGVAMLGATWFESGTWLAWKEAFELAGTSYCVTGHLLASEDRIIAWALGVPVILFCFGWVLFPREQGDPKLIKHLALTLLLLTLLAPFTTILALAFTLNAGIILCIRLPKQQKQSPRSPAGLVRISYGLILLSLVLTLAGSWHLLPLGKSADASLVRGEIIRSFCDILSFVVPALILLIVVLRQDPSEARTALESLPPRERKQKPRASDQPDPQTGLFGN